MFSRPTSLICLLLPATTIAAATLAPGQENTAVGLVAPRAAARPPTAPWGRLESYRISLQCPDAHLSLQTRPSEQTVWELEIRGDAELEALLESEGITEDEMTFIREGSDSMQLQSSLRIFPSPETILSMPIALRTKLYRLLARFPANRIHRRPFYIDTGNLSDYYRGSNLPRSILTDISRLVYPTPAGKGFFFADVPYLMQRTGDTEAERNLLRGLHRPPAIIARLRIDAADDFAALANYWSAGFKLRSVLPLIESVGRTPEITHIDVGHLLPPLARAKLNTYPIHSDGLDGRYPDWFWTCYNFFRFAPRDVYSDSPEGKDILAEEFVQTTPPHRFADLILLRSGTETIHGCIYIADDLVFTKNGPDLFSPWMLMPLEDVVAYHDMEGDVRLSVFRKRPRL